jgi:hypothetical protein
MIVARCSSTCKPGELSKTTPSSGRASGWAERTPALFGSAEVIPDISSIQREGDVGVSDVAQGGLGDVAGTTASTSGRGGGALSEPYCNERPMRAVGSKATRAQSLAVERVQKKIRALDALRSTLDARNSLKRVFVESKGIFIAEPPQYLEPSLFSRKICARSRWGCRFARGKVISEQSVLNHLAPPIFAHDSTGSTH